MGYEEFLAQVPLFANCSPEEIAAIAAISRQDSFEPDEVIVTQGTPGQAFYLILSGRVEILRDESSLGTFGPGDFFGEMSLLDQAPRSATIRAFEPTTCLMLAAQDLRMLLESVPSIALRLLEVLCRRLRVTGERLGQ